MANPSSYSLLEINQYIRRVISLNFDEPVWIECEIGQASLSRGHLYLDLIQKEEDKVVAQCQAAMWANVYYFLRRKSPVPIEDILKQGMSVKLKVNVDYHERYGLKLIIEDIDSSFTIGQLELQRLAILREIKEKGLLHKNAQTHLPFVVQRLAVISSGRAAGYKDFVKHVSDNYYGYDIRIQLFEAAMQGQAVETEILACLNEIEKRQEDFDAVAIIRGGGGRTDLAAFDNLALCLRVADFPFPVLIGIGHEIDQSLLDLVAYTSLKTPTAVADYVIERNAGFEGTLDEVETMLRREVQDRLVNEEKRITMLAHALNHGVRSRIIHDRNRIDHALRMIGHAVRHQIQKHHDRIAYMEKLVSAINPDHILKRGFTITSHQGKTITQAKSVKAGMLIQTTFLDGVVKSKVE
jgi:exodeoxyribonuclease VII large subunit